MPLSDPAPLLAISQHFLWRSLPGCDPGLICMQLVLTLTRARGVHVHLKKKKKKIHDDLHANMAARLVEITPTVFKRESSRQAEQNVWGLRFFVHAGYLPHD